LIVHAARRKTRFGADTSFFTLAPRDDEFPFSFTYGTRAESVRARGTPSGRATSSAHRWATAIAHEGRTERDPRPTHRKATRSSTCRAHPFHSSSRRDARGSRRGTQGRSRFRAASSNHVGGSDQPIPFPGGGAAS